MARLVDQIHITNHKDYDNIPKGRLRHSRDIGLVNSSALLSSCVQASNGSMKFRPGEIIALPIAQDLTKKVVKMHHGKSFLPPTTKHKRKGRPRLFLAAVIDRTDATFVVLIKFNVRNKLAKRCFNISLPAPPPVEKLSRLRPPQACDSLSVDSFLAGEPFLSRTRRRNDSRHTQKALSTVVHNGAMHNHSLYGSHKPNHLETSNSLKLISADRKFLQVAADRFLERFEQDLPYHGVLPFPRCLINKTDPATPDRAEFKEFLNQATQSHLKLQNQMLAGTTNEDLTGTTSMPPGVSQYYLRSQIEKLQFRDYLIDTWYSSPYPEECAKNKILYVCEFCLKYMSTPQSFFRHQIKSCNSCQNHPPGVEIYRDSEARIAFWEVDGRKNIEYCQSLCLLAKLFLNSKTLYYDVEPFVFYILTEIDEQDSSTYHLVGYFSKEKLNNSDYNVSCILTLPIYQRNGYGSLMIDFSYLLSRREFKYGTPEKPLSDLGLVSYRNYWKVAVATTLRRICDDFISRYSTEVPLTVEHIAQLTGMKPSDVIFALEQLEALLKDGNSGTYGISIDLEVLDGAIAKWELRNYIKLNSENLLWKPLIYGPSGGINSAPALAFISLPEAQTPSANNSISMITDFLKDDVNNPFSFEEETYKSIEAVFESSASLSLPLSAKDYHVCHPDVEPETLEVPISQIDDVKVAEFDEEDDGEIVNDYLDSEFDELAEANDVLVIDPQLTSLIEDGDMISEEEDEDVEAYEGESDLEKGDEAVEENEEGEIENEKSEVEEEAEQALAKIQYTHRHEAPRKKQGLRGT